MIDFAAGERTASGYLALPAGRGPGVLVLHAWWGLTEVFTGVCDRLAAEGFVAFAPDLFAGKRADTIEGAQALASASDGYATYELITNALGFLQAHPAVEGAGLGIIGFSFGAAYALMLEDPARAVVLFYGTGDPASVTGNAAFQGHFASDDDYEPLEGVRALEAAIRDSGREVTFHVYEGTGHWFFEPNRAGYYNAEAAGLAWERTVAFLRETIGRR